MKKETGFTFFELVLAITILLVAILGTLSLYVHTFSLIRLAEERTVAINNAQLTLEQIKAHENFDTLLATFNGQTFNAGDLNGVGGQLPGLVQIGTTVDELGIVDVDILEGLVTVGWERGGRVFQVQLNTLLSRI